MYQAYLAGANGDKGLRKFMFSWDNIDTAGESPLTFSWRNNKLEQNIHGRIARRFLKITCWWRA